MCVCVYSLVRGRLLLILLTRLMLEELGELPAEDRLDGRFM